MKLALTLEYSGARMSLDIEKILELERLGYDSVWSAESYGSDAVTPAAFIAARTTRIHVGTGIMQMAGRAPAATATTAMTLDALSGGRFRLGLGVSGPQVVEGWHGQAFGKPLQRTREYVEIVRAIFRREKPLEYRGEYYQIPYAGADATGLGNPLKSILHGRPDIPIYTLYEVRPCEPGVRVRTEIVNGTPDPQLWALADGFYWSANALLPGPLVSPVWTMPLASVVPTSTWMSNSPWFRVMVSCSPAA